jgi:hypothetical protein
LLVLIFAAALPAACANGGDSGAGSGDDGGPTTGDDGGPAGDAPTGDGAKKGDGGSGEGGSGTSAQKACADDAASYCAQLQTCAPFLVLARYGDSGVASDGGSAGTTCVARRTASCLDQLAAPGTGFTGDALEACTVARHALDCASFLNGKLLPKACRVTGAIPNSNACRYDAQCGGSYCRYASGASCGTCVALGATCSPCAANADCDGDLACASDGMCHPPVASGGLCDATHPCQQGLVCIGGTCTAPGGIGATCAAANKGVDCDYAQGAYCDTSAGSCKAYAEAQTGSACGSATPTVCVGAGTCFQSKCVAPVADGSSCDAQQGQSCLAFSTCNAGTCGLYAASQCK